MEEGKRKTGLRGHEKDRGTEWSGGVSSHSCGFMKMLLSFFSYYDKMKQQVFHLVAFGEVLIKTP